MSQVLAFRYKTLFAKGYQGASSIYSAEEHEALQSVLIRSPVVKICGLWGAGQCPDGSPLKPDTVTHTFLKIARKLGLSGVRFHDLRHTHATLMLQQGVHPKIVQERLGHATIAVTLDTYSHVLPGLQEAAALSFEKSLTKQLLNVNNVVFSKKE